MARSATPYKFLAIAFMTLLITGCARNDNDNTNSNHNLRWSPAKKTGDYKELDVEVENRTGTTVYAVCFTYQRTYHTSRWHWDKSDVYELANGQHATIDIDTIPDIIDRDTVYGYLAIFSSRDAAEKAIYELLDSRFKIDLDLVTNLKGKTVVLGVERYGFKGEILDHDFVKQQRVDGTTPELDFAIGNNLGTAVYVTCFVYQRKEDRAVWRYDKTPVIRLEPGQTSMIDVDTIASKYDRGYMRGVLGVFPGDQEKEAHEVTYELLEPENKIRLGQLSDLSGKKLELKVEQYGIMGGVVDYTVKPIAFPPGMER